MTNQEQPPAVIDEAKAKRQAKAAEKKEKAEIESKLDDAAAEYERATLESALLEVESAGTSEIEDADIQGGDVASAEKVARIEHLAAEARQSYVQHFQVASRPRAAWAARKVTEARIAHEELKAAMAREVARLKARWERRLDFFEDKLKTWAETQPREVLKCQACKGRGFLEIGGPPCVKCGNLGKVTSTVAARLPEAGVRLELRPATLGGVEILDEAVLVESLIDKVGVLACLEAGVLRQEYRLVEGMAKKWLAAHPEINADGAIVSPEIGGTKLVIVRL